MKTKIITATMATMLLPSFTHGALTDYGISSSAGPLFNQEVRYMNQVLSEFSQVDSFIRNVVADWESGKVCANIGFTQTPIKTQGNVDPISLPLKYILVVKDNTAAITFDNLEIVESSTAITGTKGKVYVNNDGTGTPSDLTTIAADASNLSTIFTLNASESVAQDADSDLVAFTIGSSVSNLYTIDTTLAAVLTDETAVNVVEKANTYLGANSANIGNVKSLFTREVLTDITGDSTASYYTYTDGAATEALSYYDSTTTGDAVSGISLKQVDQYIVSTAEGGGLSSNSKANDGTTDRTNSYTAISSNNLFTGPATTAKANGIASIISPETFGVTGSVIESIGWQADCTIYVKFYDYEDLVDETSQTSVTHEQNAFIIPEFEGIVMFFRPMERDASLQMKIVDETTDYTLAEIVEFDCFAVHIDDLDDGLIAASEQQYMLLRGEGRLDIGTGVYDERVLTFNMLLDSEILGECAYREKITVNGTIDSPYDGTTSNAAY